MGGVNAGERPAIFLSWENHRRSRELAGALEVEFKYKECRRNRIIRYPRLVLWTAIVLIQKKPKVVFCQNPSLVLTAFLALVSSLLSYKLIVDRHSNFKFHTRAARSLKWRLFHCLSQYSLRKADLTIVTTRKLSKWVHANGGRAVVLHDKIPDLSTGRVVNLSGTPSVLFICTYSWDEPVAEVLEASKRLPKGAVLYVTGRAPDRFRDMADKMNSEFGDKRIVLTGFLSEDDYRAHIEAVDLVIVLTTVDDVLLCGAYEAIALAKPLVLSGSRALRGIFNRGVVFCDNNAQSISAAIEAAYDERRKTRDQIVRLRGELDSLWERRFDALRAELQGVIR